MKRILVALDSSKRAPQVLTAAVRLAELTGAKLVVFRAMGIPPDMPQELLLATDMRIEDVLTRKAYADLEQLIEQAPRGLVEKITTAFATAWDGICTAAREQDADLIMIGSHGYGRLDKLLGTTAGKVVNHADRNVMVVRTPL
jgi:nucleotide-binding universal stress UspA family protein